MEVISLLPYDWNLVFYFLSQSSYWGKIPHLTVGTVSPLGRARSWARQLGQAETEIKVILFEISNDILSFTLIFGLHVPFRKVFLHDRQMRLVDLAEREGFLCSLFKTVNHDSFLVFKHVHEAHHWINSNRIYSFELNSDSVVCRGINLNVYILPVHLVSGLGCNLFDVLLPLCVWVPQRHGVGEESFPQWVQYRCDHRRVHLSCRRPGGGSMVEHLHEQVWQKHSRLLIGWWTRGKPLWLMQERRAGRY